eukprot:CAMPEP_0119346942 /NCGR_PEP_ID=MMETSP1333-20130426/108267_1 /TAXON_ID=418940 /ORGANISM="Scyphosphaera apsteinii, Strain RCC1455" /LENGTH=99 /DNA_ID=CAMNT_0007359467 /DNA_START=29 /DNA_END=328 /DNA_ORIENTATION=-
MSTRSMPRSLVKLYREILTAHRELPPMHRRLGDDYVRLEFRQHRGAADSFMMPFERQWRDYLLQLRRAGHGGRDLTDDELLSLSDEQKEKLGTVFEKYT